MDKQKHWNMKTSLVALVLQLIHGEKWQHAVIVQNLLVEPTGLMLGYSTPTQEQV